MLQMFRLPPGRIGNLSELDKIGERAAAGCMGENYRFLKRHRWLLLLIKSSGKSKLQGAVYERALRRKAKRSRAPTIVSALIGVFGSRATALKPVQRRLCRRLLPRHSKARDSERSRDPVSRLHHTVAGQ